MIWSVVWIRSRDMPWKKPTFLQFESSFSPALLYNNLAYDGVDRFAVIDGNVVKVTRKTWNMFNNWDSVILFEYVQCFLVLFWML